MIPDCGTCLIAIFSIEQQFQMKNARIKCLLNPWKAFLLHIACNETWDKSGIKSSR